MYFKMKFMLVHTCHFTGSIKLDYFFQTFSVLDIVKTSFISVLACRKSSRHGIVQANLSSAHLAYRNSSLLVK